MKSKKAQGTKRIEAETRIETKIRKKKTKRIIFSACGLVLAVLLYFAGRFVYISVINPEAAFDTAAQIMTAVSSEPAAGTQAAATDAQSTAPTATASVTESAPATTAPSPTAPNEAAANSPDTTAAAVNTPQSAQASPDATAALSKADLNFIKDKVNILLIGVDENPTREKTRTGFRSDVLLLLCIDFKKNSIDLLSIPRDSYASIYNTKGRWKINAAFSKGGGIAGNGFQYCMMTVSNLLGGIPVGYYVGVQMEGLKKLVDSLGGVNYKVDIPVKMNGRYLKPGMQHLTGQQVLDYCRIRKHIGTDVNRVDRQQRLLLSLFQQLQQKNKLDTVPKVFEALKNDIYTNLKLEQVVALSVFSVKLDAKKIERHTLKGQYMFAYNSKYYFLDQTAKEKMVHDIFGIRIKSNYLYDVNYVKAFTDAANAMKKAKQIPVKYKNKITAQEKSSISKLISQVEDQQKKLPNNMAVLSTLVKQLNSLTYQTEKAILLRDAEKKKA